MPAQVARIHSDSDRIELDSLIELLADTNSGMQKSSMERNCKTALTFQERRFSARYELALVCGLHFPMAQGRKGVTMDFAIILIVSNTLLAAFIYFVVTRIWQD